MECDRLAVMMTGAHAPLPYMAVQPKVAQQAFVYDRHLILRLLPNYDRNSVGFEFCYGNFNLHVSSELDLQLPFN